MKTTVEIAGSLLGEAKLIAAKEGTTLRALIERAGRGGAWTLARLPRTGDRPGGAA